MMKKMITVGLLITVIIGGSLGCSKGYIDEAERKTYELGKKDSGYRQFDNKVDGYSILIPQDMEVDMSLSKIRAAVSNDEEQIEIYRQEFSSAAGITAEVYTNYSNLFLENETDHNVEYQEDMLINGYPVSIAQWSRQPLKNIENDKCYYASAEIFTSDNECFTFLFKSSNPFEDSDNQEMRSYLTVLNSFQLIERTEEGYNRKMKETANPSWNKKTQETFEQYFGEDASLTWGIFDKTAPMDFTELRQTEQKLQFEFPVLLHYTGFIDGVEKHPRLAKALKNAKKEGRMLELTLQTLNQDKHKGNMIYDVLNGKYDTYLKNYVQDVKDYGEPILFRVGNEMNGDWCVYSAYHTSKDTEIYKAFYKYIYHLFEEAGADNVIWVWNPNAKSFPDFKWNDALCYYPGDEYVDVIGLTNYNTGTYYTDEKWVEFADLYDDLYDQYCKTYEKPLMITEFASSSIGGDKAQWVQNMFQQIKKYERLKIAIWWSSCDYDADGNISRPYFIDETEEITNVFRENLADYAKRESD